MKKRLFFFLVCFLSVAFSARAAFISVKNAEAPAKFTLYDLPKKAPTAVFFNATGDGVRLSDFNGKIVMVNVWAQSCRQCVVELPMLDALQKSFGTTRFAVVPLSVGGETAGSVARFFINNQYKNLNVYIDKEAAFSLAAGVTGLPTTLLFDADGREIGRIRGIAEWNGPEIKAQIRELIRAEKEKKDAQRAATLQNDNDIPQAGMAPLSADDVSRWFKK